MSSNSETQIGPGSLDDLHLAVGRALTAWEVSEDEQLALFWLICGAEQPLAGSAFAIAPRPARREMMKKALQNNQRWQGPDRFSATLLKRVKATINRADQLAPMRNDIAHGWCTDINETMDGALIRKGYFVLSPFQKSGALLGLRRYAHALPTVQQFTDEIWGCHRVLFEASEFIRAARRQYLGDYSDEDCEVLAISGRINSDAATQHSVRTMLRPRRRDGS